MAATPLSTPALRSLAAGPLTNIDTMELSKIDELIALNLAECAKGSAGPDGRANPAYRNVDTLSKVRMRILGSAGRPKPKAKVLSPMENLDSLLSFADFVDDPGGD